MLGSLSLGCGEGELSPDELNEESIGFEVATTRATENERLHVITNGFASYISKAGGSPRPWHVIGKVYTNNNWFGDTPRQGPQCQSNTGDHQRHLTNFYPAKQASYGLLLMNPTN